MFTTLLHFCENVLLGPRGSSYYWGAIWGKSVGKAKATFINMHNRLYSGRQHSFKIQVVLGKFSFN